MKTGILNRLMLLGAVWALQGIIICAPAKSDDILEQKKELEKIKAEIENSRTNLDSLRTIEKELLGEISDYEQRASLNKTVLERLNNQLGALRKDIGKSKDKLEQSEGRFQTSQGRYISNLTYYYSGLRAAPPEAGEEIDREKDAFRKMVYLRAVAAYDKAELSEASEYLDAAEQEYTDLMDQKKTVTDVKVKKRSEYTIIASQKEKKEKVLSKLRRKKESEADRLITLSEAARQMEDLIVRLEEARRERETARTPSQFDFKTGNFISYKGGLTAPAKGEIIKSFGWKLDPVTKLKSFSPGIEIKGKNNAPVTAVASGVVAYIGNLRGYDNFVIVEHEDGFYSTYAGLDNLVVVVNQIVAKGSMLGGALDGAVRFELREGRQPLDPVEWIRIDSFK
ncbi:MAG: peptidoglycan DD-metalloendopeptidase family protein [Candidatus Zixiibacteriota bacterium]|nr:MAG: peptidoglycan DD-metalloendopeptidase family protein [candidate division Zixibacteria bacterium]